MNLDRVLFIEEIVGRHEWCTNKYEGLDETSETLTKSKACHVTCVKNVTLVFSSGQHASKVDSPRVAVQ